MIKLLLAVLSVLSLIACDGGVEQDPLQGEPANIRNAVEPKKKVVLDRRRQQRDSMILTMSPRPVKFIEGKESVFYLKGRLINELKHLKHEIKVQNLPDGAEYDEVSGEFRWTPEKNFVRTNGAVELLALRVQIRARCGGEKLCVRNEIFNVFIYKAKNFEVPQLIKVDKIKDFYEGDSTSFKVTVSDPSARFVAPNLRLVPEDKPYDFAFPGTVVGAPKKILGASNQWEYKIELESRGLDVSYDRKFSFFLLIYGENGAVSAPKEIDFMMLDATRKPQFDLSEDEPFKVGQWNEKAFLVYVPLSYEPNGHDFKVEFKDFNGDDSCKDLVGDKQCFCTGMGMRFTGGKPMSYLCKIRWKPNASQVNTSSSVQVRAVVSDTGDPKDISKAQKKIWIKTVFPSTPIQPLSTKKVSP